ncbi:MAG: 4-(cytidine 5'-diphospho)-2-C-methyl-D-erythritol kinase [Acidimicrobiales bacterium]
MPLASVVTAPAKLTLSLRITGVRADGLHLIDAEMVALDLFDTLEIQPDADGLQVIDMDGRSLDVGPAGDNLVTRALATVGRRAAVTVRKRVPAGAGLGGGSSDAAAVLRWAGYRDLAGAARLGADVPFCLLGGRARVSGTGEVVEPLAFEQRSFTLLTPPVACSTGAVYAAWDELGGPRGDHGNDLEPAALVVQPSLARWRDELGESTGTRPRLAGSGSTWFVEGSHPGQRRVVAATIPAH